MSTTPESSSIGDVEKRATTRTHAMEKDLTDGSVTTPNAEYERYLELHHQFEGPARAKLIRKREKKPNHSLASYDSTNIRSGLASPANFELPLFDVLVRQEQCWKCQGKTINSLPNSYLDEQPSRTNPL